MSGYTAADVKALVDLARTESVDACAARVLDRHGRVDIQVNAAGWDRIHQRVGG